MDPNLMIDIDLEDSSQDREMDGQRGEREEQEDQGNEADEEEEEEEENEIVDEEDRFAVNADQLESASSLPLDFVESILRPLPLDESPQKVAFLEVLGLTTKRVHLEQSFQKYVIRRMAHRVSALSFKVELAEEEAVLEKENDHLCLLDSSSLVPSDERLLTNGGGLLDKSEADKDEEEADKDKEAVAEAKAAFLSTLQLVPVADNEELVLKRELGWLAVIQERALLRRKLESEGEEVVARHMRPVFNNLSSSVLNEWLPKLAEKCKLKKCSSGGDDDDSQMIGGEVDYHQVGVQPMSER